MAREGALFFDSVFMIESLPTGANKTGTDLYDRTIAPHTATMENFTAAFRPAFSRAEFLAVLAELKTVFLQRGHAPILHIEAHGDEAGSGLVLASGELVLWEDLRGHLEEINRRTKFNLLVVMAACDGANLIRTMSPTDRAPFWAVIGPNTTVCDLDMQRALEAFYNELLSTQNGTEAMLALNESSKAAGGHYKLLDAEMYFCWVYEKYEEGLSDEQIEERVNRVVASWAQVHGPDLRATAILRVDTRNNVRDHPTWYDFLRQNFLMLDLYPENKSRFRLTYKDCRAVDV